MAIDFPDTPTLNQEFTQGDKTWIWNGSVWNTVTTDEVVGPAGPAGPAGESGEPAMHPFLLAGL